MRQVKLFRGVASNVEEDANEWLEHMSEDPTFKTIDVRFETTQYSCGILIVYEIESEKEKEKRHRIGMEMAKVLADPPKEELIGSKPWMKRPWSEEGEE